MRFVILCTLFVGCTQTQLVLADDAEAEAIRYAEKNRIEVYRYESKKGEVETTLRVSPEMIIGSDDIKALAGLKNLTWITLYGGITPEGLELLVKFPRLERIYLDVEQIDNETLNVLAKTKSYHFLSVAYKRTLENNKETDAAKNERMLTDDDVIGLNLGRSKVTDVGLKSLLGLKNLQALSLRELQITSAGLKTVAKLKRLESLELSASGVTNKALVELSPLQGLQELSLDETEISDDGIHELAEHQNLKWLNLSKTRITDSSMKSIAKLPRLAVLDLSDTAISIEGFQQLKSQKRFRKLLLKEAQINDELIAYFMKLKLLYTLPITYTRSKEQVSQDEDITYLEVWKLQITDATFIELLKLPKLIDVGCSERQLTDDWLRISIRAKKLHTLAVHAENRRAYHLAENSGIAFQKQDLIENLDLTRVWVTGAILAELKQLPKLSSLFIVFQKDTEIFVQDLASLEKIERLCITKGKVGLKDSGTFASLKKLSILDLTEVTVSDEAWKAIGTVKGLEYLGLTDTDISTEGVLQLSKLEYLTELDISNEGFITDHLKKLFPLKRLQKLWLKSSALTNDDLKLLVEFKNLKMLNLRKTNIDHNGVKHLLDLKNLKELKLTSEAITNELLESIAGTQLFSALIYPLCDSLPRWYNENFGKALESKSIDLRRTRITDEGLHHFKNLPKVILFELSSAQITVKGLKVLQDSEIEILVLDKFEVTNDLINALAEFKSLNHLRVPSSLGEEAQRKLRKGLKESIKITN